jgi:iron complex outermembrane recepter protein
VKKTRISNLKYAVAPMALGLALLSTPSFAQEAPQAAEAEEDDAIVVTGSLFRTTGKETASPVTILTSDDLDKRGIDTVQEALQTLTANNGGTLPNSFTANGAFAGGASAASLRGLTTSSTLVLFDGLRAAYYPLADDGSRNFVDLNTIPDAIVERVEVLKDGASANYGADAIAGVINIITRKQITGLSGRIEAGITGRGDAAQRRAELTYGYGDLDDKGFNAYVSGHYYSAEELRNSDRGFPYNTSNLSRNCAPGGQGTLACEANNVGNGIQADGTYLGISTGTLINYIRPRNATNTANIPGSRFQQLTNPAGGCGPLTPFTLTGAQLTNTLGNGGLTAPANGVVCQEDFVNRYSIISPKIERLGGSARITAKLSDTIEAYAAFNFEQSTSSFTGLQSIFRGTTTTGPLRQRYTTASTPAIQGAGGLFGQLIALPVFVCPRGTTVPCTVANGTLNPNNPFAAAGQQGAVIGRFSDINEFNQTKNQSFRGAVGITGELSDNWKFDVDATAMRVNLDRTAGGRVFVQHLLDVINDGSYNWVRPDLNTQAVRDYVAPTIKNRATSELFQVQGNVNGTLMELSGGPLQLAVGASYRFEKVNAPSLNPGVLNQPTQQYIRVNGFSAAGSRNVKSAYFELDAPVHEMLDLNVAGRFDSYSTGNSNFSPKFSAKFTPIQQISLRGTFSKGFRIPSFAETGSSPTTGFITTNAPASCLALHPGNTAYCQGYGLGLTQVATPGLKPEKSRSFTLGAVFEPIPALKFTVDYYNIQKTNVITGDDYTPAIAAYYANQPIPAGFAVIPDVPDIVNPNAQPRAGFVEYNYINGPKQNTSGIDFTASARFDISNDVSFSSSLQATKVLKYSQTFPNGDVQNYVGTLGNFQITSGSGTPRWRGSWQNTVEAGAFSFTATAYYNDGYSTTAEDSSGAGSSFLCGALDVNGVDNNTHTYRDGSPVSCFVKSFIYVDTNMSVKVNDKFTFYVNVLNLLDAKPPYDGTTYGGYQYNPAWANSGIYGRQFRAGVKFGF